MIRLSLIAAATVAISAIAPPVRADGTNEIRAVTYSEDGGMTRIHVRGAQTPTFTVYKLDKPSRVVIDVPRARLVEALRGHESGTVFTTSTWAVSTIAAQQLDDGGQLVRVIVTLARPGRYDVKTTGNEVVVMVTARDPAPKPANADALVKAEQARAEKSIAAAQADAQKARDAAVAAQAEAERLRKAATEQAARAEAAQRAAQQANATDLAKAKADADRAKRDAAKANAAALAAQADAEKMRLAAERAKQDAIADAAKAKQQAEAARVEADRAKQIAARETESAKKTRDEAEAVRLQALRDAEAAKRAADAAKQAADAAKAAAQRDAAAAKLAAQKDADAAKQDLARVKGDADKARREAEVARRDAERARADAARTKLEADALQRQAEAARREAEAAQKLAEAARNDVAKATKDAVARTKAEADKAIARVRHDADAAVANAKADAQRAKADAERARADANAARASAETTKRDADRARGEADKLLADAKRQIAALDKKMQTAQLLEDKARAANAAAEAREQVAREQVATAKKDREAAEAAARLAVQRAADATKGDRDRLAAEAKLAEERVAKARKAAEEAEARRLAAEGATTRAKQDLETTRTTLATVEKQRTDAEVAANNATRKRGEAEAAADDATRRRTQAETAALDAGKKRREAEQAAQAAAAKRTEAEQHRVIAEAQRKAAEDAARVAKAAADAADKQRIVAEKSAREANAAKQSAEKSLDELTTRRLAAEHAAAELEQRTKAEAKAHARVAAAQAHKANDADVARARAEAIRLADERKRAEAELTERRKAVVAQQAETTRLEGLATQARDAAAREETRRARLAEQRVTEEKELARLRNDRDAAKVAKKDVKPVDAKPVDTKPGKAAKVTDVAFRGSDGAGQVDIAMTGDAKVTVGEVTAHHVELIIDNAELGTKLERKLDVTRYGSPVRAVSSFRDRRMPNRIRLIAELSAAATPTIDRDATGVKWRFVANDIAKRPTRTQQVPPPVVSGFGATSTPLTQQSVTQVPPQGGGRRRVYRGATVDFDFKDAPIHDLLRIIADTGRVNIVVPDNVNAKVTVRLKRVPWDQALEVILASHDLWYRREGNLYRVAPRKDLDKEDAEAAARRELEAKSERPRPEVIRLNYADAKDLAPKLQGMVSPSGSLQVDERQNALIINDVTGNRNEIARLALSLDTQTPQISIEARIVEARSTFLRQFGVQWGGKATATPQGGNATGLLFPSSINLLGGNEDSNTVRTGVAAPSDFAINLPAGTGSGEGGAIGLSLGSIGGNFALNLRLSALEDTGTIRIISAPKITVLNNKAASILQGVSIPIQVVSAQGTQTQLVQADLRLEVTPYVSPRDCAVQMKILVQKNEPDFVNVGARGDPSFLRKEASTTMLVNDGDTSVLGGIYTRNTGLAYKKIPFFGDLPVLGWFFKNRRENDDRNEILVFITPKITNKGSLACQ